MGRFIAIDLFCGAGGLSYGLKKAGFTVKVGVDIDKNALLTYQKNFKKTKIINKDIREISPTEISELAQLNKRDNFLLAGCPPCQGFSSIGKRDADDEKNELVYEYVRIVKELEPSFILMENVPGMSRGVGKHIFSHVVEELKKAYFIEFDTLNAADYGVPQIRKRLVLQGVRKDVHCKLLELTGEESIQFMPKATYGEKKKKKIKKWKTVGETIMDLPALGAGEKYEQEDISNHICRHLSRKNQTRLEMIRLNSGNRDSLPDSLKLDCHKKKNVGYTDTYGVMKLDKPAPTITTGCTSITKGRFGHPTQNRGLSAREAARLQSFDDKFVFVGNIGDISLQIGNAVPPKLAEASARNIKKFMLLYRDHLKEL